MKSPERSPAISSERTETFKRLAQFRYRLRCFLRFSERVARSHAITPQQHQLMLGVAGYTGRGWATVSELAEFLQGRHNAVVGLVQRAEERGLVKKVQSAEDRRFVQVHLTRKGFEILDTISRQNLAELRELQLEITQAPRTRPGKKPTVQGT